MIKIIILSLTLSFSLIAQSQEASQTIYEEDTQVLQVKFVEQQFIFSFDDQVLFSLPESEMDNFIQVAADLENYDVRVGQSVYAAKVLGSIMIGIGTGGLAVGGATVTFVARMTISSAPFFLPEPEKDNEVVRLTHLDLPYFSNPQNYSRWELPKKNLKELVEALQKIYEEYSVRLSDLRGYNEKLMLMSASELSCGDNQWISLRSRGQSVTFNATKAERDGQTLWYTISLPPSQDGASYNSEFGLFLEEEIQVARVQYHEKRQSILSVDIIRYGRPGAMRTYRLNELLATVGVRTWQVNAHYIAPRRKKVKAVYKWAMALRECLSRGR